MISFTGRGPTVRAARADAFAQIRMAEKFNGSLPDQFEIYVQIGNAKRVRI